MTQTQEELWMHTLQLGNDRLLSLIQVARMKIVFENKVKSLNVYHLLGNKKTLE